MSLAVQFFLQHSVYTHFRGLLSPDGILPGAKFTLRPSLAFSYIGSVTARHSSSGRQQNCSMVQGMELQNFRRARHLYLAGRPSRWAWAHILVSFCLICTVFHSYSRSLKSKPLGFVQHVFTSQMALSYPVDTVKQPSCFSTQCTRMTDETKLLTMCIVKHSKN